MHHAAALGHKDVAELLLANKAEVNAKDKHGATPLHWAASEGHKEVVEMLLAHDAEVNAKTNDGWTALHRQTPQPEHAGRSRARCRGLPALV